MVAIWFVGSLVGWLVGSLVRWFVGSLMSNRSKYYALLSASTSMERSKSDESDEG
jgi:hypothetical protein